MHRPANHLITFVLLLSMSSSLCTAQCDDGWFGPTDCKYQCHCAWDAVCDKTSGSCPGSCDPDWFGPQCQYDSTKFTAIGGTGLFWLVDSNDGTCNNKNSQHVTVTLDNPHPLTWVRLVVNRAGHLDQLTLEYRVKGENRTCSESNSERAAVDDRTVDIMCPTSDVVSHVTVSGSAVTILCSLYISGGRNVALKQPTFQHVGRKGFNASYAVDGNPGRVNPDPETLGNTCSSADRYWHVVFTRSVKANRLVLYNRRDPATSNCCEDLLADFILQALSTSTSIFWRYTDAEPEAREIYTVVVPSNVITRDVGMYRINKASKSTALVLCEVIVFGETSCPPGRFGRECERECNCAGGGSCFVSTGGCPSGCAAGYTGEDCYTQCRDGKYGLGCAGTCSPFCGGPQDACHPVTGVCVDCDPGYRGFGCEDNCPERTWGNDCLQNCSVRCEDQLCNPATGDCLSCPGGKTLPSCEEDASLVSGVSNGVLAGGVAAAAAVVVIIVVIIAVVICRRRKASGTSVCIAESAEVKTNMPTSSHTGGPVGDMPAPPRRDGTDLKEQRARLPLPKEPHEEPYEQYNTLKDDKEEHAYVDGSDDYLQPMEDDYAYERIPDITTSVGGDKVALPTGPVHGAPAYVNKGFEESSGPDSK